MSERSLENKKKTLFRIIIISTVAIIFVPILYSGIYLSAFWDPYGNFSNVPVAFVNLDKAVDADGKEYNLGRDIENNLKKNKEIGWKFVSLEEAKKGVSGTTYYAAVIIPENFSKQISQATGGDLSQATVLYEANKGKNFVFAQVSERAAESIKAEVTTSIQEQITKSLVGSLYDIDSALLDASKGAGTLQDGTKKLLTGSKELNTGLLTAADGAKELQNGLKQALSGEEKLTTGMDSLISGLNQFKNGFTKNSEDLTKLVTGANDLSEGISAVSEGTKNANLPKGLTAAADSIGQIKDALNQASTLLDTSQDAQSIAKVQGILGQLIETMNSSNMEGKLRDASSGASTLESNLNKLSTSANQLSTGVNTLSSTLSSTQSTAISGVTTLTNGAIELKSGSENLTKGFNTAVEKMGDLADGLTVLSDGSGELTDGITTVNDGTIQLRDGLKKGYNNIDNNLKFSVKDMAKFITNPLTLSDVSINTVPYYGQGLAPYFISLSLWLGAMLMNLIISLSKLTKIIPYKFFKTYTGVFFLGSALVIFQAVILSIILMTALGINPVNPVLFFIGNMFISVIFFSIMYGVSYAIGIVGTPIIFILFILQLASSGGTFPIETSPRFFRVVSPFFPMTYTVEGLRMIISGINASRLIQITIYLILFMLVFFIGGFVVNKTFIGLKNIKAEAE